MSTQAHLHIHAHTPLHIQTHVCACTCPTRFLYHTLHSGGVYLLLSLSGLEVKLEQISSRICVSSVCVLYSTLYILIVRRKTDTKVRILLLIFPLLFM